MKFFKPEDFDYYKGIHSFNLKSDQLAAIANAKLEREGKIVFQQEENKNVWQEYSNPFLALVPDAQERTRKDQRL